MSKDTQLTMEQMQEQIIARMNKEFELKQQQREMNEIQLGARLILKRVLNGKPIIDKDTNEQKVFNGIPQCYPDKYFVTLQFIGGELETEIKDSNIFDSLEQNKMYLCTGYLGEVKNFGVSELKPIITKFTQI